MQTQRLSDLKVAARRRRKCNSKNLHEKIPFILDQELEKKWPALSGFIWQRADWCYGR